MNLITLTTDAATATVSPYGAQVMSFRPTDQPDVLWQSSPEHLQTALAKGKALRGGIPLCWPWFLAPPNVPEAPSHGVGRIRTWDITSHTETASKSVVTLSCTLNGTEAAWPYATEGRITITLTDSLTVELTTTNRSEQTFRLTQALHTYLNVADIAQTILTDLSDLNRRHVSSGAPLPTMRGVFRVTEETEHLVSPVQNLTLTDTGYGRRITVSNSGSDEVVIWNPWADKAATLDMPPQSYRQMLCLEAANIDHAPLLGPGQSHTLRTRLYTEAL